MELEKDEILPSTELGTDLRHAGHLDKPQSLVEAKSRLHLRNWKLFLGCWNRRPMRTIVVRNGPPLAIIEPVVNIELERIEALELLGMTLAHLNDAESRADMSPRVPLLMTIRDKLARGLREEE